MPAFSGLSVKDPACGVVLSATEAPEELLSFIKFTNGLFGSLFYMFCPLAFMEERILLSMHFFLFHTLLHSQHIYTWMLPSESKLNGIGQCVWVCAGLYMHVL